MISNNKKRREFLVGQFLEKKRLLTASQIEEKKNSNYVFFHFESSNTGCGDSISFLVKKNEKFIDHIFFNNEEACIVVVSATNMICSWIEKKKREFFQVQETLNNIRKMVANKEHDLSNFKEIEIFKDLGFFSNRKECILLVIKSFEAIILKIKEG